jgi:hypothetical protein
MTILIFEVSFHRFRVSPVEFSSMAADAFLAPKLQAVLVGTCGYDSCQTDSRLSILFFAFSALLHFCLFNSRNSTGFWSKKQI